jgi:hypothetical protein
MPALRQYSSTRLLAGKGDVMTEPPMASDTGYSPDISAELILHGERFDVISLGPGTVRVRSPKALAAGTAVVRMFVDGRRSSYVIDLQSGMNPGREEQAFSSIRVTDEVAA